MKAWLAKDRQMAARHSGMNDLIARFAFLVAFAIVVGLLAGVF
jgi:hypothetical protein